MYKTGELQIQREDKSKPYDRPDYEPAVRDSRFDGEDKYPMAYLPHSCQEWVIGGVPEMAALISDLRVKLLEMAKPQDLALPGVMDALVFPASINLMTSLQPPYSWPGHLQALRTHAGLPQLSAQEIALNRKELNDQLLAYREEFRQSTGKELPDTFNRDDGTNQDDVINEIRSWLAKQLELKNTSDITPCTESHKLDFSQVNLDAIRASIEEHMGRPSPLFEKLFEGNCGAEPG